MVLINGGQERLLHLLKAKFTDFSQKVINYKFVMMHSPMIQQISFAAKWVLLKPRIGKIRVYTGEIQPILLKVSKLLLKAILSYYEGVPQALLSESSYRKSGQKKQIFD